MTLVPSGVPGRVSGEVLAAAIAQRAASAPSIRSGRLAGLPDARPHAEAAPTPPDRDYLEMTVLGDGYGESVCIHLGEQRWVVIDSFLGDEAASPAAWAYLDSIGVQPGQVAAIVQTHWDLDHCLGIGTLAEICGSADLFVTAAMSAEELATRSGAEVHLRNKNAAKLLELSMLFKTAAQTGRVINEVRSKDAIVEPTGGDHAEMIALSPSKHTIETTRGAFGTWADGLTPPEDKGLHGPENNRASIATAAWFGDNAIVCGADLEERGAGPHTGWQGVVEDHYLPPRRVPQASLLKLPHHGSKTGYAKAQLWAKDVVLNDKPVAVLTPWRSGGWAHRLPSAAMIDTLGDEASELWTASDHQLAYTGPVTQTAGSTKPSIRNRGRTGQRIYKRVVGRVTARRPLDGSAPWKLDAHGAGRKLRPST